MRFEFNVESNNITYNTGDTLLVDFSQPFYYVDSINDVEFDFTPIDTWEDGHDISIRWSYDITPINQASGKPNIIFSGWVDVIKDGVKNPNLNSTFEKIIEKK